MDACKACRARGKTWGGDDPKCAFTSGAFGENWQCATVDAIRDLVYEGNPPNGRIDYQYCEDQKYATVCVDEVELPSADDLADRPLALWVTWYKNRGGTDAMWLLSSEEPPRLPTEGDLLAICRRYGVKVAGDGE